MFIIFLLTMEENRNNPSSSRLIVPMSHMIQVQYSTVQYSGTEYSGGTQCRLSLTTFQ